jgi:hypothetical protein
MIGRFIDKSQESSKVTQSSKIKTQKDSFLGLFLLA